MAVGMKVDHQHRILHLRYTHDDPSVHHYTEGDNHLEKTNRRHRHHSILLDEDIRQGRDRQEDLEYRKLGVEGLGHSRRLLEGEQMVVSDVDREQNC